MNGIYKVAGTVACGAGALLILSGCWSRAPRPQDQTSSGSAVYEPSGATYSQTGAAVDSSDSQWQRSFSVDQSSKPEAKVSVQKDQNLAPVDNSSSQWQKGYDQSRSSRATVNEPSGAEVQGSAQIETQPSASARVETQPSASTRVETEPSASAQVETQPSASAQVQTQPYAHTEVQTQRSANVQVQTQPSQTQTRTYTSQPVSEGPNSGGKWRPGYAPVFTAQPAASQNSGWLPAYSHDRQIHEASGSANYKYSGNLQEQLDQQQQQLNRQQHEINELRHELNQERGSNQQQTPSSNTTTP